LLEPIMIPNPRPAEQTEKPSPFTAPSIALPKGGGAIRGMGEKFAANPVSGTGSLSVPIATSPGRSGFGPQLALTYDSGAGNGPFGFGWNLSLPAITRKTDKGLPRYLDAEESDVFILSGAEDLVPVLDSDGTRWSDMRRIDGVEYRIERYRPRIEGLFARIERWTTVDDPADVHWRSISSDNVLTLYGKDAASRIADPQDSRRIFSWLICETRDDKGNAIIHEYKPEDGVGIDPGQVHERNRGEREDPRRAANRYLKHIRYGNRVPLLDDAGQRPSFLTDTQFQHAGWMFEVVFDYGEHAPDAPRPDDAGAWTFRDDPFSSYRAGFEVRTTRLCQRVLMFHHFPDAAGVGENCLVRSTDFTYSHEQDPDHARNPVYTFLLAAAQAGYQRDNDGYLKRNLPPVEFEYTQPIVRDRIEEMDAESLENLPIGLDGASYQWTDLHGEGIPGILTEQGGGWFYKRNLSPLNVTSDSGVSHAAARFAAVEQVATKPNLALTGGARFMDLAGDGQPDLVVLDGPMPGLYEHDGDEGWQPFRPFASRLNRDTSDPNLRFVDLDGDGHADVLITEDDAWVWHASLAEAGFGPARRVARALDEEKGPRLVFADGTQSIYLADFSGDGLTDLVRVRNGEVCYWPNLGYGRFGAKVAMDHAPHFDHPDLFDQKRLRLADIDGSGTSDIIYLHRDGVRLYFNQSGNSWSEPQVLRVFPRVDDVVGIAPTDLLGNGTACLVWSSPSPDATTRPMRYVNLMGGQKPHLLVKTVNNLGAETRVHYAPSTKFYLQDKRDGTPWITRLPFPVHVIERVETYDHISQNRFVSRYAYHHGHFDGEEREFRGFGMVEQWDTGEIAALTADGAFAGASNLDTVANVPPVHTKTWFHTGVYLDREHISRQFEDEYYREPGLTDQEFRALLLPDTTLPDDLTLAEEREACRALKGMMLRQEVYADDAPPGSSEAMIQRAKTPYTVVEQDFTIRTLQRRVGNRHAIFFTHPREVITCHYERHPADPRIQHALTLEVDDFGNVLQSAAVGYGRRQPDLTLSAEDQAKQAEIHTTYTENGVTHAIEAEDDYRTPLPSESRTYELTGLTPPAGHNRFTLIEMLTAGTGAAPIAYEQSPIPGVPRKRLIEQARTLYRPDDLGAAQNDPLALLPLGTVEPLALPGESYRLAFTPNLLQQVFQRDGQSLLPNPAAVLGGQGADQGGYVDLDGDGNGWVPLGRIFLSPDTTHSTEEELNHARSHFFLPHRYRDPFGQDAFVDFDANDLLMVETRDALGNRVTVDANDYRVLQPRLVSDPNRNHTQVAFDALGMVVGTAIMGKPEENLGDSLDGFAADLVEATILDHLADPLADPHAILGRATTRLVYDLFAYQRTRDTADPQPAVVYTLARETHDADLEPGEPTQAQHRFSYSDGFGREIQQKIQAEPETLNGDAGPPRWVGSGWTIFNNKGKPVRQYEPFFSATHGFEFGVQVGVSPVLFYDPMDRVVATLHPNHTYEKVVFDPWRQTTWDVNDTVLSDPRGDSDIAGYVGGYFQAEPADWQTWREQRQGGALGTQEQTAAQKTATHANTPTTAYFDTLGRPFLNLAHDGFNPDGTPILFATRVELDIEGNQRAVMDALDRVVMRYDYDLLGNRIHQISMEAGARWMLNDVMGNPIRAWDSRDHSFRTAYDPLRRPTDSFLREGAGMELVAGRNIYGESRPNPEANNLRGKVVELRDQAGVVTSDEYDFKGNLLRSGRRLARDYKTTLDWAGAVPLEPETYTSSTTYDALNRPVTLRSPDNSLIRPGYNEANLLERVDVMLRGAASNGQPVWTPFVTNIDYDAKGQRQRIDYGNGATTAYDYDPLTFRLVHLQTKRDAVVFPDDCPQPPPAGWPGCQVQNLRYTYDPAGNITHIRDDAQQRIFFNNQVVEPSADYTYDAIYRLVEATGREHLGQNGEQIPHSHDDALRSRRPHPNDGNAMGRYCEKYIYDAVGNFIEMSHHRSGPASPSWTRRYEYDEASLIEPGKSNNRLSHTTIGNGNLITEPYTYDAHGNMTRMDHLPLMRWDYRDQLQATAQQVVKNGGTPEITYYVYDAAGQRVRKVTENYAPAGQAPTRKEERIYLNGFEIYRKYESDGDTVALERETLHIMDDKQRIALVETRTQGSDLSLAQLIRYQFGNHLGSASLELDGQAQIISYEEYTPYGSTSYQAVRSQTETPKRYQYTGKERDEESGLDFCTARYYAAWLGRWLAVDPSLAELHKSDRPPSDESEPEEYRSSEDSPAHPSPNTEVNTSDGLERERAYVYCSCNPILKVDPDGRAPVKIGHIYTVRATVNGEQVVYSGQTARELAQRLLKDKHKWSDIIKAKTTTIEAHPVSAELNVAQSSRGTLASAKKEALSAAEQVVVKRRRAEVGVKVLNSIEAAEEANILKWADRHNVQLGARFTFRSGVKVGAFAGFALLDAFMMYRDQKLAQYVMAPYVLEDEKGVFTLQEQDRGIFRQNYYFKTYQSGDLNGKTIQISKDEFLQWKEEGELLWGTTDWKGDFVPGLLRPELPVVSPNPYTSPDWWA
jgi:RHS repeat-associated protein